MGSTRLRLASLFAVAALAVSACGSATPAASGGGGSGSDCTAGAAQGGANLQIPDVVAGKFNVAMVLIGPHDDGGWSQAHYEGLQYLCQNLPGSHVAYIELVPEGTDSEQVFRSLARKGFNFIIGTSFGYMDPMETVAKDFPDTTFLHLTGYKSNGKNFGNFFGAVEDFKYLAGHARGLAGEEGRHPEDRLHGDLPDPRGAPPRQRDHPRRQGDLPGVHGRRPLHQHLARPAEGARRRRLAVRRGRRRRLHRRRHAGRRRRGQGEGQVGGHVRPPVVLRGQGRVPHRPLLDLGSRVRPDRPAGEGQEVQGRLRVLRRGLEGDGPLRLHGRPDPPEGPRRPAPGRRRQGQVDSWPTMLAGKFGRFDVFAGPIKDNTGKELLPAGQKLKQSDLDQFPPGAPGSECSVCMYWWNDGITSPLPPLS